MFVQKTVMYVVIVVFYGDEFKFTGPNTWNFIVYYFLGCLYVSWAKEIPKCLFTQKTFFGAYILIDLLNLTFQNLGKVCSYLYVV